jgi:GT2 family glycosyltransferase
MGAGANTVPLSIVIITHERKDLFERAFRSARVATARYPGLVEIIVANSSPSPARPPTPNARELHVPHAPRAAAKRDLSWRLAIHPWIVFLDDDCERDHRALDVIAAYVQGGDAETAAYFGVTEFRGHRSIWFRALEGTDFFVDFEWARERTWLPWGPTSLAVFRAAALADVGGFDGTFRTTAGGEDVDICLRLRERGWKLRAIPRTLVHHNVATWNSLRSNLHRARQYGKGEAELMLRHRALTIFDIESPLLLLLPGVALPTVGTWAGVAPLAVGLASVGVVVCFTAAQLAAEHASSRKSAFATATMLLYRGAYRLGLFSGALRLDRGRGVLRRLDWNSMIEGCRHSGAPSVSVGTRIKWTAMLLGAALIALAMSGLF